MEERKRGGKQMGKLFWRENTCILLRPSSICKIVLWLVPCGLDLVEACLTLIPVLVLSEFQGINAL